MSPSRSPVRDRGGLQALDRGGLHARDDRIESASVFVPAFFFWLVGLALFWRVPIVSGRSDDGGWTVSVVIPARDEESTLGRLLASLARQEPPPHEVIVVDDHSRDATARVARAAGATLVSAEALPDGWSGKPLACLQGARRAKGRLLLFLDADTWLEPGGLARLVASYREAPGLLSVQPYHQMADAYERLGALFNLITMIGVGSFTLLGRRLSPRAAFGPCVLVARGDYMAVGGHERAAGALLEGLPLGRAFADAGYEVRCLGGRGSVSFRMYPDGLKAMIDGFARGFATGAGSVPAWLLVAIVGWVVGSITTARHVLAVVIAGGSHPELWITMACLYIAQMRWMLRRIGNFGWWPAILFPVPVVFFIGVFFLSLFRTLVRRQVSWKERSVRPR